MKKPIYYYTEECPHFDDYHMGPCPCPPPPPHPCPPCPPPKPPVPHYHGKVSVVVLYLQLNTLIVMDIIKHLILEMVKHMKSKQYLLQEGFVHLPVEL